MKIHNFTVCDLARVEDNGKFILIGVYSNGIIVQKFPANLPLTFWMLLEPNERKSSFLKIRGVEQSGTLIFEVEAEVEFPNVPGWGAVSFSIPVNFPRPGSFDIEASIDRGDWTLLRGMTVAQGEVVGAPQPLR